MLGAPAEPIEPEERFEVMQLSWRIVPGDCREGLASLDAGSVQTCVTSPPYFGLRDYGHDGQIGLEPTPAEFCAAMVAVFREVRRVLADDGTLWLNLGDSFAHTTTAIKPHTGGGFERPGTRGTGVLVQPKVGNGVKPKDLLGIPWMVAFALRADGWYLRSDIIWHKPNPMPESVTDRPTKAHEYLFLLSKGARYFYNADAIREEITSEASIARNRSTPRQTPPPQHRQNNGDERGYRAVTVRTDDGRNRRSVWTVATQPFAGAHFATFPPKLIEPCILAGCPEGGVVLDPFAGSGTTGMVALRHGRSFVGCELNPEYVELARRRITDDAPLLNQIAEAA